MRRFGVSLLLLCLLLGSGCSSGDPRFQDDTYVGGLRGRSAQVDRANFDNFSYWDGDGVQGPPSIEISLGEQKAFFFKGGELVGVSAVSAGREGFGTPVGNYKIIEKDRHHKSNLYGDYVDAVTGEVVVKDIGVRTDPRPPGTVFDGARMPYFMRIVGGVGMHEGFLPGYPASHGCIRLPGFMASAFFHHVEIGTPVSVTP